MPRIDSAAPADRLQLPSHPPPPATSVNGEEDPDRPDDPVILIAHQSWRRSCMQGRTTPTRLASFLAVAALVVGACGGGASPSPAASSSVSTGTAASCD